MTYFTGTVASATNGSEIITALKSALAASGWSTSDGGVTYSSTSGGTTLTVAFTSTSMSGSGNLSLVIEGQTFTVTSGNSTLVGSYVGVTYSIAADLFYLRLTGPVTGQVGPADASYGSPTSFILLTKYTPYLSSNSDTSKHKVVVSSYYAGFSPTYTVAGSTNGLTHLVRVVYTGGVASDGELLTVRPAVQDITSVGDQVPSSLYGNAGIVYWPYIITSASAGGIVGRLNNVFFASEAYLLAGDSVVNPDFAEVFVSGNRHVRHRAAYFPSSANSIGWTPLGSTGPVNTSVGGVNQFAGEPSMGGPYIIVKKGDGT